MKTLWLLPVVWCAALEARVIEAKRYHLGVEGQPEWAEFEGRTPHGPQLELKFPGVANATEATLLIRQQNVKTGWNVTLNGQRIGTLETLTQPLVRALSVRAGLLRDGENVLTIARGSARMLDDIVVGEIELEMRPRAEVLGQATLEVTVTEAGAGLPCRITIVDEEAALAPVGVEPAANRAVRTGVVYTGEGKAKIGLRPGRYVVHAGRGFEYSVATEPVTLRVGETKLVKLEIRREVPTEGLVACDTHIHTLTHSRHGDATIEERMVTIAGEGIELAVATDHNHHVDYTEAAERTGMRGRFRSIVGNEVSTKAGHFTAFPVRAGGPVPDAQLTDWVELVKNIRSVSAARVVALNHPRDVHQNFTPFGPENFDVTTGALRGGIALELDAIEVVTSAAMQSDVMQLYRDWFALLNYGYRVAALGASDTHHVSEFILGQSRTYAVARDGEPGAIDVDEVVESYRAGRLLVSMGLLAQIEVDGKFRVGDVATELGEEVRVAVTVHGPSWVTADRVELFANGIKVREAAIAATDRVEKARVEWRLPRPRHDVHLVAVATGPGVTAPYWEISRPYQPSSKVFTPRVIGSTNPVWVDADGDGKFSSARALARTLVDGAAGDRAKVARLVEAGGFDAAVQAQVADLVRGKRP